MNWTHFPNSPKRSLTQPHAAFSAFIHGLKGQWTYLLRTIEEITPLLKPLEDSIRQSLLPALTGKSGFTDTERELLALPGDLGLVNPTTMSEEHASSLHLTAPLTDIVAAHLVTLVLLDRSNKPSNPPCARTERKDCKRKPPISRPDCPNTC